MRRVCPRTSSYRRACDVVIVSACDDCSFFVPSISDVYRRCFPASHLLCPLTSCNSLQTSKRCSKLKMTPVSVGHPISKDSVIGNIWVGGHRTPHTHTRTVHRITCKRLPDVSDRRRQIGNSFCFYKRSLESIRNE